MFYFQFLDSSIPVHDNFRLIASMNPVGDVDRQSLPPGFRSRFTEIFVEEIKDFDQLSLVVRSYLPSLDLKTVNAIINFYDEISTIFPGKFK